MLTGTQIHGVDIYKSIIVRVVFYLQ